MADEDPTALPTSGAGDVAHKSVKAVLGAVPVAGSGLAEFFDLIIAPPLRKKQDTWMASVSAALWELKGRVEGFEPERLAESPAFAPAVLRATQAAMKTTDKEKLTALRNALLNVAIQPDADSIEQDMFLYLVDRLTPFHLQVLYGVADYCVRKEELGKMPKAEEFPSLASDLGLTEMAIRDLLACHLLSIPASLLAAGSNPIWTNKFGDLGITNHLRVSELGKRFLAFISVPEID